MRRSTTPSRARHRAFGDFSTVDFTLFGLAVNRVRESGRRQRIVL
jgi:hypothetical protein